MLKFNEYAMVSALCSREQDAHDVKKVFNPDWLKDAELKPVLKAVFDYMDSQATTPSIPSLSQFMEERDKEKFNARWRTTIEQLKGYDTATQRYNVAKAKEAAAAMSLHYLIHEQRFQKMLTNGQADALKGELSTWLAQHTESDDEGLFSIQEAFDKMVDDHPWKGKRPKIGTGLKPIDLWSGGLRSPQMGIIMAPSGHGKSACLMNVAFHAAAIEDQTVLFITNEMTTNEQTERFAVRMQQPAVDPVTGELSFVSMNEIQDEPSKAYKKLQGYQAMLSKRLFIYSANLGQTVEGVEDVMKRVRNEHGVWPDMVVIDYIERMSTVIRMDKGATWTYYGQIAKELVWLAKRRNCSIWTAIQTNRSGMRAKAELGMDSAQGSIQHLQEAALLVAVKRVKVTDATGQPKIGLEFAELKSRHGAMEGRKMVMECDLSRMHISDKEIEGIKEIEDADTDDVQPKGKKKIMGQHQVKNKP